ncbi:MAG: ComF family protein [Desulfobulbaceae bacterium]|nr:ComF family protein [Desulfobulbaceae bacterium]
MEKLQKNGRQAWRCWLDSLVDLFFPAHCLQCRLRLSQDKKLLLCDDCLEQLSYITPPYCVRCGHPFLAGESHLCGTCLITPPAYDRVRSLAFYQEPLSNLLMALKYQGDISVLSTIGELCQTYLALESFAQQVDLIIPVPLHPARLRKRGFNQAQLLAACCFPDQIHLLRPDVLMRRKNTIPQTQLSGVERRQNLSGIFVLSKTVSMRGKRIILVDDVFTTGSTVNECAKVLRRAGADEILVFTPARSALYPVQTNLAPRGKTHSISQVG